MQARSTWRALPLPSDSIVLLHACCHNPTGVDLSSADLFTAVRDFGGYAVGAHAGRPRIGIWEYVQRGLDPAYMGLGPVPAVRKALSRAGLTLAEIDLDSHQLLRVGHAFGRLHGADHQLDAAELLDVDLAALGRLGWCRRDRPRLVELDLLGRSGLLLVHVVRQEPSGVVP